MVLPNVPDAAAVTRVADTIRERRERAAQDGEDQNGDERPWHGCDGIVPLALAGPVRRVAKDGESLTHCPILSVPDGAG